MKIQFKFLQLGLILLLSWVLAACNSSSSSSTPTLTGTAATGAAMTGFVYVKDKAGTEVNVAIGTDGTFTVEIPNMTAPFMVRAVPNTGATLYSFANAAGQTVNVTPLTNLAVFLAGGSTDLSAIYSAWNGSNIAQTAVQAAQATVNANLAANLSAEGLDGTTYDFMKTAFQANSKGIDKVLDGLKINVDLTAGTFSMTSGGTSFSFNKSISTSGITIGGTTSSTGGTAGGTTTPTTGTLPSSVAGKIVTMTFGSAATGAPYNNGDQVLFTFSSSGSLMLTDKYTVVNTSFSVVGSEYVWEDTANSFKYSLSLSNDAIHEVNVSSTSGTFLGQFSSPVSSTGGTTSGSTGGTTSSSSLYTLKVTTSGITTTLPGTYAAPNISDVQGLISAGSTSAATISNVSVTSLIDTEAQKKFSATYTVTTSVIALTNTATYDYTK